MDSYPPSILSLCAGYGGIDLGLKLAIPTARTVGYVEIEATAADVLVSRMEDASIDQAPIWTDLKAFDGKPWRGRVDILTAGYPCQPFSAAGLRRGTEDPRHLFPHVARIIREVDPELVFLENVSNHLRIGFEQVLAELRAMGRIVEAGLFTAEEVGAPHLRQRLFVLSYRPMDNCTSRGFGILRQSSGFDGQSYRSHTQLADAARNERDRQIRKDSGRRRRIRKAGDGVADAGDRQLSLAWRGAQERAGAGPAEQELADTEDAHRRGELTARGAPATERGDRRSGSAGSSRIFPPGPADTAGWREYLTANPQAEPAICRSADGATSRVDRLRMLGNGVVPLVAGYAFCSLARAACAQLEEAETTPK